MYNYTICFYVKKKSLFIKFSFYFLCFSQLSQGRRTASLKASLEAINSGANLTGQMSSASGVLPSELPISKELAGVAHLVNPNMDGTRKHRR